MRYCVSGDSLIVTENGLERIDKISDKEEINLKLLSKDKKINNSFKWFDSGEHETIRITTNKGYQVTGTKNHPILTLSSDRFGRPILIWKLLENVREGDISIIDRREDEFWPQNEVNLRRFYPAIESNHQHRKILPESLNEDLAFILGSLVAEGTIGNKKIEFCNSDKEFIDKFEEKWNNVFPNSRLHKFEKKPPSYGKKIYWRLECHSIYTIDFLRNIGLIAVKSDKKTIPELILQSPKKIVAKFLQSYFEGDGSISYSSKMVELSCCSKSLELIKILQIILLRFGIDSAIRFDKYKNIDKLYIRGKRNILRFYKDINFTFERKRKKLEFCLYNYKKDSSLSDFVPFISDFVRGLSHNEFIMKNNFDRYGNMKENYQRVVSLVKERSGIDLTPTFEYFLTYNYLFDPIAKIENAGINRVFSVKVDSECHSFISNGFISHNTEARMSPFAEEMLEDIDKETVKFVPNFDNSVKEPSLLPGKFPALILNGASGIAVGMATNIPPQNLTEICDAIVALINKPEITIEKLAEIVKGPDFPTGGYVSGEILEMYRTGKGRLIMRGRTTTESINKNKDAVIITEIPYMVNKADLITQIAKLIQDKKIADVTDLRDESAKGKIRIVIEHRKNANSKFIINKIFKFTRLQESFNANLLALDGNVPKVLNLKQILEAYVKYRKKIITKRTEFDLKKAKERQEIVEGLLIALKDIDHVIDLIKKSKSAVEASEALMKKYNLSKRQTQAILETKLQQLTSLEQDKLKKEAQELKEKIAEYEKILKNIEEVLSIIKKEVNEMKRKYGDNRRTQILQQVKELSEKDLVQKKDVVVTITDKGYCKRMDVKTYKEQKRGGSGVIGSNLATEDFVKQMITCSTHDYLMFFTTRGKVYWLKAYELPEAERYSKGKAVVNMLNIKDEEITNVISVKSFEDYLFMATSKGQVKKIALQHFSKPRSSGVRAINMPNDNSDTLIDVKLLKKGQEILLATKKGLAIRFAESEVREMGRASYGVTGVKLGGGDSVVSMEVLDGASILSITEKGYGKRSKVEDYRKTARAGKGVINLKVTSKTGNLVNTVSVADEDSIIITTAKGMVIRTTLNNIRIMGRATQGVRLVKLKDGDKVTDVIKVVDEEIINGEKSVSPSE